MECWNCGRKCHLKCDCKELTKPKKKGNESNLMDATTNEDSNDALVLCVDNNTIKSWILDTCASFHSISCKKIKKIFATKEYEKVFLVDCNIFEITIKYNVRIELNNAHI